MRGLCPKNQITRRSWRRARVNTGCLDSRRSRLRNVCGRGWRICAESSRNSVSYYKCEANDHGRLELVYQYVSHWIQSKFCISTVWVREFYSEKKSFAKVLPSVKPIFSQNFAKFAQHVNIRVVGLRTAGTVHINAGCWEGPAISVLMC